MALTHKTPAGRSGAGSPRRVREKRAESELGQLLEAANLHVEPGEFLRTVRRALLSVRGPSIEREPAEQFDEATQTLLTAGGLDLSSVRSDDPDPVAVTAAEFAALLSDAMTVDQAATQMELDPSRVRQMLRNHALHGIREDEGWRIPRYQFGGARPVRGLGHVLQALSGDLHPVAVWRWLTRPDPELEIDGEPVAPIAWVASGGDPEPVIAIARDL